MKRFTPIVPAAMLKTYERFGYAPAVRAGGQLILSGVIGFAADRSMPADFRTQIDNVFTGIAEVLAEAGASLDDVVSLTSYHVGDMQSQLADFVAVKAARLGEPHPVWTAVGVTALAFPGALVEVAAVALAPGA